MKLPIQIAISTDSLSFPDGEIFQRTNKKTSLKLDI